MPDITFAQILAAAAALGIDVGTKISALPAASAALGTTELASSNAGVSESLTVAQIQTFLQGSGLPGVAMLNVASDISTNTGTGAAPVDVDATNLAVTFTAPASGKVLVTLSALWSGSGGWNMYWGVREGAGAALGWVGVWASATGGPYSVTVSMMVTGLSAGSHTLKWCHGNNGGGAVTTVVGGNRQPATMTVFAA